MQRDHIPLSYPYLSSVFLLAVMVMISTLADARIYRYQDENGKWHFSDKPITQQQKADSAPVKTEQPEASKVKIIYQDPNAQYAQREPEPIEQPPASASSTPAENDLAAQLQGRFSPQSAVEIVTLAVVTVETPMSVGSGFFISEDGYLLTNKHVIRPGEGKSYEKAKSRFTKIRQQLAEQKQWLEDEATRLANYKTELDEYQRQIQQASSGQRKNSANADYELWLERYQEQKDRYDRFASDYQRQKAELNDEESVFRLKTSAAQLERRFKILLKDDTELRANLVAISRDYDLALLKLEGYKTPMIPAQQSLPSQGEQVYAIGSPLGIRDTVTSGIITRSNSKTIMTDAQILPGNSGGPLITATGEVVGINTLKVFHLNVEGEGFGVAIPLSRAYETFADKLP